MANELTIAASLRFVKGDSNELFNKSGIQLDVSGTDYVKLTQTVGTSEEALSLGDLTTPGYALIYNRDSTNFVSVRSGTGADNLVKVPAGGIALFMIEASAPFVIADTASCQIEMLLIEA
jgi:hypothetical protein